MSNIFEQIKVFDHPRRICGAFSNFKLDAVNDAINNGDIISEVGTPTTIKHPTYKGLIPVFTLRKARKSRMSDHMFGKCLLGDAFSGMTPRVYKASPVGERFTAQAVATYEQYQVIDLYDRGAADAIYIIDSPAPLGTAIVLEAFCPEFDNSTQTHSVRWKPSAVKAIAFFVPWSSDLKTVDLLTPRDGQSGLSICVRTVEDNSSETLNTPLNITVLSALCNVRLNTKKIQSDLGIPIPGFNSTPAELPPAMADIDPMIFCNE